MHPLLPPDRHRLEGKVQLLGVCGIEPQHQFTAGATHAAAELVLGHGRKLRVRQGVDDETLRAVLVALEPPRC